MVQHYAIRHAHGAAWPPHEPVPMLHVADLLLELPAAELQRHIIEDAGGSSRLFLEYVLQPGSRMLEETNPAYFAKKLTDFGPALVSDFGIRTEFGAVTKDGVCRHFHKYRLAREKPSAKHAMVMVGTRIDEDGKIMILLQNWWDHLQFVEADQDYLKLCGGRVWFVETPQLSIRPDIPVHFGSWFENGRVPHSSEIAAGAAAGAASGGAAASVVATASPSDAAPTISALPPDAAAATVLCGASSPVTPAATTVGKE